MKANYYWLIMCIISGIILYTQIKVYNRKTRWRHVGGYYNEIVHLSKVGVASAIITAVSLVMIGLTSIT